MTFLHSHREVPMPKKQRKLLDRPREELLLLDLLREWVADKTKESNTKGSLLQRTRIVLGIIDE